MGLEFVEAKQNEDLTGVWSHAYLNDVGELHLAHWGVPGTRLECEEEDCEVMVEVWADWVVAHAGKLDIDLEYGLPHLLSECSGDVWVPKVLLGNVPESAIQTMWPGAVSLICILFSVWVVAEVEPTFEIGEVGDKVGLLVREPVLSISIGRSNIDGNELDGPCFGNDLVVVGGVRDTIVSPKFSHDGYPALGPVLCHLNSRGGEARCFELIIREVLDLDDSVDYLIRVFKYVLFIRRFRRDVTCRERLVAAVGVVFCVFRYGRE